MSESGRAATALEVSVSFGWFENNSLSWEKWSSFSPNKYLEEVGKYSTPGSVAQKKAYFEVHYKKIAGKKAEQSEQEKPIASPPTPTRDESEKNSHVKLTYVADEELELSSNGRSGEDLDLEEAEIESLPCTPENTSQIKLTSVEDGEFGVFSNGRAEGNLDHDAGSNLNVNQTSFKDGKEDAAIAEDRQECSTMKTEEKLNDVSNNIESNDKEELIQNKAEFHFTAREETANIQEETSHTISHVTIVEQSSKDIETNGTLVKKNKSMKGSARDTARKMTLPKRELNQPEAKKKVASPPVRKSLTTTKFLHESTSGLSKSTIMPDSQPSTKKTIRVLISFCVYLFFIDQYKAIDDEGMPMYGRPFMCGKLYIHFTVEFPDSLSLHQVSALEKIPPPKAQKQLTDMEIDECEETTLHDVDIEQEMRRRQAQAHQEAYDEDDDMHGGAQRVQCAQQ